MEIKQQILDAEVLRPELDNQPVAEPQLLDIEQLQWVSGGKTTAPGGGW